MPYDPTRSIQGSADLSPTTLILNQLKAKGVPLNAANVRRAVMENARNGNQAGPDPVGGLRSMEPISSPGDPGVGGSGNVAAKVEGGGGGGRRRGLPVPPVPPSGPTAPMDRRDTSSGAPTTSAPPASLDDLTMPFAMGAGGGAAAYGLNRFLNRGAPGAEFVGNSPMDPTGRMIDVPLPGVTGPPGIGGANSALPVPDITPALPPPQQQIPGPAGASGPTDMEAAMQKAIAPPGAEEPMLGGVRPMTPNPMDVINKPGMPPGVSDVDAARAAIGPGGMDTGRVGGAVGVPEMPPLASNPATRGMPMPAPNPRAALLQSLIEAAGGLARGVRK